MPKLTRITRDPAVMGGKPCIRGMRVTVGTVVGLVAVGRTGTRFFASIPTLRPRTSPRPSPMPPGALRKSKFRYASREASRGYEPVAKLGRALGASRVRGRPLVHYRCCDCARRRDPDAPRPHARRAGDERQDQHRSLIELDCTRKDTHTPGWGRYDARRGCVQLRAVSGSNLPVVRGAV